MEDLLKENNILLAEFLGWKTDSKDRYITPFGEMDESGYMRYDYEKENLQFDCDWNWLMLVVEKILKTDEYHDLYIDYSSSIVTEGGIKLSYNIKEVHTQCIDFIKWFNNLK